MSRRFPAEGQALQSYSGIYTDTGQSAVTFPDYAYTRAKFAVSVWARRLRIGASHYLLCQKSAGSLAGSPFLLRFDASNKIEVRCSEDGSSIAGNLITTATYTSVSAFYHILLHYDSANATTGDRMRLWVNGTEVVSFSTDANPAAAVYNGTTDFAVGNAYNSAEAYSDCCIIENAAFFDNVLPAVTDLRDAATGKPISPLLVSGCLFSIRHRKDGTAYDQKGNFSVTSGNVIPSITVP